MYTELTAGVMGIHLRNLKKDRKGNDSVGEIHVNIVSGMTHLISLEFKHSHLIFSYCIYCSNIHLSFMTGNLLISPNYPVWVGALGSYLVQRKPVML